MLTTFESPPDGRSPGRRSVDAVARAGYRLGFPLLQLWWRLTHPTLEGVYVAVWHAGRVLLIRNSYYRAWSFPAGRRGRNEPPARAAARELREEVGIDADPERLVPVGEITIESSSVTDHVHVFELHAEREPAIRLDHREVVWAGFEMPEAARARPLLPVVGRYLAGRSGPSGAPAAEAARPPASEGRG